MHLANTASIFAGVAICASSAIFAFRRATPVTAPFVSTQAACSIIIGVVLAFIAVVYIQLLKRRAWWPLVFGLPIVGAVLFFCGYIWVFGVQLES